MTTKFNREMYLQPIRGNQNLLWFEFFDSSDQCLYFMVNFFLSGSYHNLIHYFLTLRTSRLDALCVSLGFIAGLWATSGLSLAFCSLLLSSLANALRIFSACIISLIPNRVYYFYFYYYYYYDFGFPRFILLMNLILCILYIVFYLIFSYEVTA